MTGSACASVAAHPWGSKKNGVQSMIATPLKPHHIQSS
jgi:hypothetical protein